MTINIPSQAPNRKKRIILLSKVKIRLITDSESDHWNEVISKYHYIGNANLTGRQLRYVVQFGKYTIALLSFSAPALALTNREKNPARQNYNKNSAR